jgi:hypothetical protein
MNLEEVPELIFFLHLGHLFPRTPGIPHNGHLTPSVENVTAGITGNGPTIITVIGILISPLLLFI